MTIHLSPEQITALRVALKLSVEQAHSTGRALWDAPAATKQNWADQTRRIEDLADLLRPATTVIIHQS